jgi:hypothetical protein
MGLFGDREAEGGAEKWQPSGRRCPSAAELEDIFYGWIQRRTPAICIGPPGVGKTYAAEKAAQRAVKEKIIFGYEILTGTKELSPDVLFEPRLIVTEKPPKYIKMLPSLIKKHCGNFLLDKATNSDLVTWPPKQWFLLLIDEATRCSPTFLDACLGLLNNFSVNLEGETSFAPFLIILLGNPAGMDASTAAFSNAVTSRLYERVTMYQPGPEELAMVYTKGDLVRDAARLMIGEIHRPSDDEVRLIAAAVTLTWGLPLDRKGIASLSDDACGLLAAVEAKDTKLAGLMRELGELVHFGADPRRCRRWGVSAMERSRRENVPFSLAHLVETAVDCLAIAGKQTFSEGQEPHSFKKFERLLVAVVERFFNNKALHRLVLDPSSRPIDLAEPVRLAEYIAPALLVSVTAEGKAALERLIRDHHRQLVAEEVADVERRRRLLAEFLRSATRIVANQAQPESVVAARVLARNAHSRLIALDGSELDESRKKIDVEGFETNAARDLIRKFAIINGLSAIGQAVAAISLNDDGTEVPLIFAEEVRLALKDDPRLASYRVELEKVLRRHPLFRGCAEKVAIVLKEALSISPGDVCQCVTELFPQNMPLSLSAVRSFFADLFGEIAAQAKPPYRGHLETFRDEFRRDYGLA